LNSEAVINSGYESNVEAKIIQWWNESGGKREELTKEAENYFKTIFKEKDGNKLYRQFSLDGIEVIPNLFKMPRTRSLNLCNIMISKFISQQEENSKPSSAPHSSNTGTAISDDENYIIEYIGGYILHKMALKNENEEEMEVLDSWIDHESEFESGSLIETLNVSAYGRLTKPTKEFVDGLRYIERQFRKHYKSDSCFTTVYNNLSRSTMHEIFGNTLGFDSSPLEIIQKVCKIYIKLRCYQKAKKLNEGLKKDQNVSFRKQLKGGASGKISF